MQIYIYGFLHPHQAGGPPGRSKAVPAWFEYSNFTKKLQINKPLQMFNKRIIEYVSEKCHSFVRLSYLNGMDDKEVFYGSIRNQHSLRFICYLCFDILTTDQKIALWSKDPDQLTDL